MDEKALRLLGLATRGRNVVWGMDAVKEKIGEGKVKLLITACDLADNSRKKIESAAESAGVKSVRYSTIGDLSRITGNEGKGIFGVTDPGLAKAIEKEITLR